MRVAVSLAGVAAAWPPTHEKAEVSAERAPAAARGGGMVGAELARSPIRGAEVTAELAVFTVPAAFELSSPTAAALCCRRRPPSQ